MVRYGLTFTAGKKTSQLIVMQNKLIWRRGTSNNIGFQINPVFRDFAIQR